uniref:Uncharacterized protein n=2 Tax=Haplochromini TaxID=319058 RepID=A0A3B4GHD9_9CICH
MLLTPTRVKGRNSLFWSKIYLEISQTRVKTSLSEGALRPSDLLAQFKQIESTTRTQIRAAELLDNTVELIREMVYTNTMMQPNAYEDTENLLHVTGCSAELQTPSCQTDCLSERYRSVTGECNNRSEHV